MKIKNLHEEIKNLEGETAGFLLVNVDSLIEQVKIEINSGSKLENLLEYLEGINKKSKKTTYYDIYKDAIFSFDRKETKPNIFAEAMFLAEKLRDDGNFLIKELTTIQERIPKTNYSNILKARAIVNIEIPESEKKKEEENKDKDK